MLPLHTWATGAVPRQIPVCGLRKPQDAPQRPSANPGMLPGLQSLLGFPQEGRPCSWYPTIHRDEQMAGGIPGNKLKGPPPATWAPPSPKLGLSGPAWDLRSSEDSSGIPIPQPGTPQPANQSRVALTTRVLEGSLGQAEKPAQFLDGTSLAGGIGPPFGVGNSEQE